MKEQPEKEPKNLQVALQPPAWRFELNAAELCTMYQALRIYLQSLSQQGLPPTGQIKAVAYLLEILEADAIQASQYLQGKQNGCP